MTELGNRLKEARLQKNLSLEDLQTLTKIQKRYLVGIEEGNYDLMPGKFYVRAFIKQYAEAVGINPDVIFEEYKNEIPNTYNEDLPEQLSRVQSRKSPSMNNEKVIRMLPKILTAVVIFLVAVAVWVMVQKISDSANNNQMDNPQDIPEMEESIDSPIKVNNDKAKDNNDESKDIDTEKNDDEKDEDNEKNEDSDKPTQKIDVVNVNNGSSTLNLSNTDKFVLEISTSGESWVEVSNGKGHYFLKEKLAAENNQLKTFDLSNETEVKLKIGRSTETEIKINDQVVQFPVDPKDEVVQIIKIQFQKQ